MTRNTHDHTPRRDHGHHADHRGGHGGHDGDQDSEHKHHVDHTGHEEMFRNRFWVSLILSVPVVLYDPMIHQWLDFTMPAFPGTQWITPMFAILVFFYGGLPFLQMASPELRNRQPGMMMLISLAITVAFGYSVTTLFLPGQIGFFWELVTLIDIMLLGHWIEMRSVRQASGALDELAKLMPDTAERISTDGSTEAVPATALRDGDLVLVRPGASVPADGVVEDGESDVSEAMITGESKPVQKRPGDQVIGGTINGDGSLRIQVTATGEQTALAGIMRLVKQAQQSNSKTQILADKAAGLLFYVAIGVAAVTAIVWTIAGGFGHETFSRVATVLVIACPHALGLAVPLVVAITTAMGATNGILVRDRLALEKAREITTVMFDKTGTLAKGEFGVVRVTAVDARDENDVLALAAAIEGDSEHTIARGIRRAADERKLTLPRITGFEAIKRRGVKAERDGSVVLLGGPRLLELLEIDLPRPLSAFRKDTDEKGQTAVYLIQEKRAIGGIALADVIRSESRQAVRQLHTMGIEVAMLTGDSEAVARAVSEEVGIDQYFAEVLPEHKDQKVVDLQRRGKKVAMVGGRI